MISGKQVFKQMMEFNKTTLDNTFNVGQLFHEQSEKMTNILLDQASWIPKERRKAIDEWLSMYKKGYENIKDSVDENLEKVESFFLDSIIDPIAAFTEGKHDTDSAEPKPPKSEPKKK